MKVLTITVNETNDQIRERWYSGWRAKAYVLLTILVGGPNESTHVAMFGDTSNITVAPAPEGGSHDLGTIH